MTTSSSPRVRGDIGLGDLAKILAKLDLKETRHLHLAANVLGFEGIAYPQKGKPEVAATSKMRQSRTRNRKEKKSEHRFSLPPTPEISVKPAGHILNSTLKPLPLLESSAPAPDWLKPSPPERQKKASVIRKRLFTRNRAAGIMKASLAVRRQGRRLDIPKVINHVVSGKPLTVLPQLQIGSVENGVDLFCDFSESMQPFYADFDNLKKSLFYIFGNNRYRFFEYDTDPSEAISWSAQDEVTDWMPVSGRPVVLATDFGQSSQGAAQRCLQFRDWRKFLKKIRRGKTPLLVCSPLPPSMLPRWLGREIKVIHWDPRTRAGSVSRIFGIGHEIKA